MRFRGLRPRPLTWQDRRQIADAEILGSALDSNQVQAKAGIAAATMFIAERSGKPSVASQ
jgi:hypothetical protein